MNIQSRQIQQYIKRSGNHKHSILLKWVRGRGTSDTLKGLPILLSAQSWFITARLARRLRRKQDREALQRIRGALPPDSFEEDWVLVITRSFDVLLYLSALYVHFTVYTLWYCKLNWLRNAKMPTGAFHMPKHVYLCLHWMYVAVCLCERLHLQVSRGFKGFSRLKLT